MCSRAASPAPAAGDRRELGEIAFYGLPDDYLQTYRDRVNEVDADQIQRVAQQYVTPERAAIVIVGDAAEVSEQVKPYSSDIEVYNTEGRRKAVGSKQ